MKKFAELSFILLGNETLYFFRKGIQRKGSWLALIWKKCKVSVQSL